MFPREYKKIYLMIVVFVFFLVGTMNMNTVMAAGSPAIPCKFAEVSGANGEYRSSSAAGRPSALPIELSPSRAASAGTLLTELDEEEITAEKYYRLIDSEGELITITGRRIRPGDRYLDEKNRLFEVRRVRGYTAEAGYIRTEELNTVELEKSIIGPALVEQLRSAVSIAAGSNAAGNKEEEWPRKLIAIYHTHNAESYVPTDGTESVYGRGGIHDVGAAFKEALEEKDINVLYSDNMHLPHDRGAYRRSRDTALELLEQKPDAIFDLHRDAAPIDAYAAQVEEEWVTKIQFVVGRQNPSYSVTRRFAYDLKGLADKVYPGLVKGVFMGWGNYNQDLTPLNLLLEVGAHQNSKEAAEGGIALFADVVALYFYGIPADEEEGKGLLPRADDPDAAGGVVYATIAAFLLLVGAALGGFYIINNPAAWSRLREGSRRYFGANGLVWREGFRNLALLGKIIISWIRNLLVYLVVILQLVPAFVREIRRRLML